ncbi:putative G protein alpha q subunit [Hypsibius exemplaris]|uniref:G protein alpha q subunit n=1 Tax=Hypsibius exemplaris TaxID=2072580 RepID=A0A9X6RPJ7_HYPEX|nr:putative G protein alpha q subunit [Hypsibius exemplaris]
MTLFRMIVKEKAFSNSNVILCLNKLDLFEHEIDAYELRDYFDDYNGPARVALSTKEFILEKYRTCNEEPHRSFFHHFFCAVDTEQFQKVFVTVLYRVIRYTTAQCALNMATCNGSTPI